jgi:hypothetical protein
MGYPLSGIGGVKAALEDTVYSAKAGNTIGAAAKRSFAEPGLTPFNPALDPHVVPAKAATHTPRRSGLSDDPIIDFGNRGQTRKTAKRQLDGADKDAF